MKKIDNISIKKRKEKKVEYPSPNFNPRLTPWLIMDTNRTLAYLQIASLPLFTTLLDARPE